MVREVGEFARAPAEILVPRRALESGGLGDGAKQRCRRAAAERIADDKGPVGIDLSGEFTVRRERIEQQRQVTRALPPCQETLGAIGFGGRIAVMVDADGDKAAPGEVAGEPFEM